MTFPNWIDTPIAEALGWTLLHSLWICGLITVVAIIWMRYRSPRHAVVRSNLWLLAMVATLAVNVGALIFFLGQGEPTTVLSVAEETPTISRINTQALVAEPTSWTLWLVSKLQQALPWFVLIYLLGLALHVVRLLGGWIYLHRLRQSASDIVPEIWKEAFHSVRQQLPLKRAIQLRVSDWAKSPVQIGHFRPFIMVPEGLASVLTIREMEALLAHEIAHILRNDYVVNWMQSFIEVLFFYHPAVWYMSNQVRTERELACDDLAMQVVIDPKALAKALVAHEALPTPQPRLALGFAGQKNQLLNRVQRILNISPMNTKPAFHWPSLTLGLVALLLLVQAVLPTSSESKTAIKAGISLPGNMADFAVSAPPAQAMTNFSIPGVAVPDTGKDLEVSLSFNDRPYKKAALKMKNGEIVWLKVDGKKVKKEAYGQYQDLIRELSSVGDPDWQGWPLPPAFAVAPPAPPTFNGVTPPVPPTPPTPPVFSGQPPMPPAMTPPIPPLPTMTGDSMTEEEWEAWEEQFKRQMEAFEEQMEHFGEQMESWQNEYMQPFEAQMEAFGEEMDQWGEQFEEQYGAQMEVYEKQMEQWEEEFESKFEVQMEAYEKQMEEYEEQMEKHQEHQERMGDRIGETLVKDGLIKDDDHFRFYIDNKEMKVNGEVQPARLHQKYLKIMEEMNGRPMSNGSSYSLTK